MGLGESSSLTKQPEDGRFRHDLAVRSGIDWNDARHPERTRAPRVVALRALSTLETEAEITERKPRKPDAVHHGWVPGSITRVTFG